MKTILEYLNSKVDVRHRDDFPEDFCIVLAFNKKYDKLCEEWDGALVVSDVAANSFIMPIRNAEEYYGTDLEAYEIPTRYGDMDDLEEDLSNGEIDFEDLHRIG